MEKVAIYCRLSVEDNGKMESESITNQRQLLEGYAKDRGWVVYEVYIDDDYSGLREDRPAFCKMLADGQAGKFSVILCKTQSRFTRSISTAEKYLHDLFPAWGIRFVSIVDGVDTDKKENKKARQINSLVNEWYCEELSENIRTVLRKKMEAGQFLGNFAPYGYRKEAQNRHHLVVAEAEADVVRQMAEWYLEGMSYKAIAQRLTTGGIPTPSQAKRNRGEDLGRPESVAWSGGSVRKILQNPVYIGHMVQGKERKVSYRGKKTAEVPREQWIVVENTHEGILDSKTFERMQARRARKAR